MFMIATPSIEEGGRPQTTWKTTQHERVCTDQDSNSHGVVTRAKGAPSCEIVHYPKLRMQPSTYMTRNMKMDLQT